ncbi:MAG: hypothetical protein AB9917_13195 [Negativicutes bacterium]
MSKSKTVIFLLLILSLTLTGCGQDTSSQKTPPPVPVSQPAAPAPADDSTAVTTAVQSAVRSFLSNDFTAAQKSMLLLPAEQKDPQTQRMFADFSLHLNKRLALEAKDAGLKTPTPSLSVSGPRAAEKSGMLADVSIRAAEGLEPITLTVKTTRVSGVWLVDFAPFMLAVMDALEED